MSEVIAPNSFPAHTEVEKIGKINDLLDSKRGCREKKNLKRIVSNHNLYTEDGNMLPMGLGLSHTAYIITFLRKKGWE